MMLLKKQGFSNICAASNSNHGICEDRPAMVKLRHVERIFGRTDGMDGHQRSTGDGKTNQGDLKKERHRRPSTRKL